MSKRKRLYYFFLVSILIRLDLRDFASLLLYNMRLEISVLNLNNSKVLFIFFKGMLNSLNFELKIFFYVLSILHEVNTVYIKFYGPLFLIFEICSYNNHFYQAWDKLFVFYSYCFKFKFSLSKFSTATEIWSCIFCRSYQAVQVSPLKIGLFNFLSFYAFWTRTRLIVNFRYAFTI